MSQTIGIYNGGVITSLLVKDHPIWMWYREAVQNGIEATQSYIAEKNISNADIHIRKLHLKGLVNDEDGNDIWKNKLSVLNLGGMDYSQLSRALQLGGSGKVASLNANYGVGIKTSVLDWSDLLFITYKNGIAHYAMLGKQYTNGIDFDIVAWSDDGEGNPVVECTEWVKNNAAERGYDLDHDFTEVVIMGTEVNQDTFLNTFGWGPDELRNKWKANHIKENLCRRYFRLPENIKIKIEASANTEKTTDKSRSITFTTFTEAFDKASNTEHLDQVKKEVVETFDGIKIHYFYDGPCGEKYSKPDATSTTQFLMNDGWTPAFSGLVWRDEVYDPKWNNAWRQAAFRLGIQDKFQYFRIFVELPDKSVTTDKYRTSLYKGSTEIEFASDEMLHMIVAHMPEWFKEKTKETKKDNIGSYEDRLKDMFAKYMDLDRPIIGKPNGDNGTNPKRTVQGKGSSSKPKGGKGSPKKAKTNPALVSPESPEIIEADESHMKNLNLKNNFCEIVQKGGTNGRDLIVFNPTYKSIEKIAELGVKKTKTPEEFLQEAKSIAKDYLVLNAALWLMICRSRLMTEKMSLNDFTMSISNDFVDTYLFARELQITEDVKRDIEKTERQQDKIISSYDEPAEAA